MKLGTTIGQYRIVRQIGSGGMGAVFLGEHALLGRPAAIKTLLPALSRVHEIVDRFFNEARATSAIADPGVVQIFDFGYHVDGTAYIVMEYLEGEQLDARIERLARLPMVDALRIARQLACALEAAHLRGIVHRDLKPENVFVVRDHEAQGGERPKLLDFGIAKVAPETDPSPRSRTQTGAMLGTPTYMSPEQCRGAGEVEHRSDQYALGCVLFHMLTGIPPFDGAGVGEIIAAHLREPAPAPSSVVVDLPPAVDELVLRCLAKSPDDRYPSMAELQLAIEAVLLRISARRFAAPIPHGTFATGTATREAATPPSRRPTTIGAASGETPTVDDEHRPRPLGLWAAAGIFLLGGVAAFVVASRVARSDRASAPSVVAAAAHDAGVPIDAPAPRPPIDAAPPPIDARAPIPRDAAVPPIDAAVPPIDAGLVPKQPKQPKQPKRPRRDRPAVTEPAPRAQPARRPRPAAVRPKPAQDLYDIR